MKHDAAFESKVKLPRRCVFCGNKPSSKTIEHILPRWLLRLTGDEHREVVLQGKKRPFSSFQFPACYQCNQTFNTELEIKAGPVVKSMVNGKPVSAEGISIFLDWLDKVRVGLWLASLIMTKNEQSIEPKFEISDRYGTRDRMVAIYRLSGSDKGLAFIGTESPVFQRFPSCFVLRINQLAFFNMSVEFLFARRLGFPYPGRYLQPSGSKTGIELTKGKDKVEFPLLPFGHLKGSVEIFQPMFVGTNKGEGSHYNTEYVRGLSLSYEEGIGKPLLEVGGSLNEYPIEPSHTWIPAQPFKGSFLRKFLISHTMLIQQEMWNAPGLSVTPRPRKRTS